MAKHSLIKIFEISAIVIFALVVIYLLVTGVLSSTGVEHAWPYPHK
ncbi:hypothetical protein [Pantoea allii]|nr:hypothetical protein [Pantoea allii]MBW1253046.1 hypothetical protein [Pantoea allii]MBW1262176.1 hypothetical protein [Pantoea allii]MBW1283305.1 hypothetical protein [Pantoea allii]